MGVEEWHKLSDSDSDWNDAIDEGKWLLLLRPVIVCYAIPLVDSSHCEIRLPIQ